MNADEAVAIIYANPDMGLDDIIDLLDAMSRSERRRFLAMIVQRMDASPLKESLKVFTQKSNDFAHALDEHWVLNGHDWTGRCTCRGSRLFGMTLKYIEGDYYDAKLITQVAMGGFPIR